MSALSDAERDFVLAQRVVRLATADAAGTPHVVPVCFALDRDTLVITIDAKPKRPGLTPLKRLGNIAENPMVALIADRYDEDWGRLGWVMLRGVARILTEGAAHDRAQALLRARYPQYFGMDLQPLPVITVQILHVTSWGDLSSADAAQGTEPAGRANGNRRGPGGTA